MASYMFGGSVAVLLGLIHGGLMLALPQNLLKMSSLPLQVSLVYCSDKKLHIIPYCFLCFYKFEYLVVLCTFLSQQFYIYCKKRKTVHLILNFVLDTDAFLTHSIGCLIHSFLLVLYVS